MQTFQLKKNILTLAALTAIAGAAQAQSTVTLYGVSDVFMGSISTDKGDGKGSLTQTVVNTNGVYASNWGMKGTEDLGGGLKANFKLEGGINMDTGATTQPALFGRQAWVGVSGGFGEVQLGRMTTAVYNTVGASDAMLNSSLGPLDNIGRLNNKGSATGATLRFNNAVSYSTPTFSGFNATVQYALGENKSDTTSADSAMALSATYANGPVGVQAAYQAETCKGAANLNGTNPTCAAVATETRKFSFVGAEYNFGVAVLKGTLGHAENIAGIDGASSNEYQIGVDVPVSAALVLTASYANAKDNSTQSFVVNKNGGDVSRQGYGIGAKYILSKRTFVYGGYESDKQTQSSVTDITHSIFAVGLTHLF